MKTINSNIVFIFSMLASILLGTCTSSNKENMLFTMLPSSQTGIHFINDLHDSDSSHSFINEFGYMGAGVGIGDFNNDGLKDIFFTGNQVSCRLYINKGDFRFDDITSSAGLTTNVWCTGVSIVDINQDGFDDIYICVFGKDLITPTKNLLFINQQDLTFKEAADSFGIADTGYSTQAAFFDYDRDGDLDMYLTNYLLSSKNTNTIVPRDRSGRSPANDRLYQNQSKNAQTTYPAFIDVTLSAGIKEDGYGLGLSISDFNNDGWPDVYVANDFVSNDLLWLNNGDGTFSNYIDKALKHQSYSSMGSDAADINNDGWPEIMTLDMLPEYNERKKTTFSFMNYDRYEAERAMGYEPEFMRNMLQLNNGTRWINKVKTPFFSEIGHYAGIEATDWSWSVLLADFNNDGWKDMHITNGIGRDFINADFLEFSQEVFKSSLPRTEQEKIIRNKLSSLNHINLKNYLYINNKNLTFTNEATNSGIGKLSMSNGAVYADLDNDGDLDLVVNNISSEAFVYKNNTNQKNKPLSVHYLSIRLKGDDLNKQGFGTKVLLYTDQQVLYQEQNPVRGYFSSVDQQLNFGLGSQKYIDSLCVIWPDGFTQSLYGLTTDTTINLFWKNATPKTSAKTTNPGTIFNEITSTSQINYKHVEYPFNDYNIQRLAPQKYSQQGPHIAVGDINNDGLEDFFIGGAINFSGEIFTQQNGQKFTSSKLIDSQKMEEDIDCIFFDADNDQDQDLLITGGDIQYSENSINYKPRLYLNDGEGHFTLQAYSIPDSIKTIASCVSSADFDGDGDQDLFIGGRVSKSYPMAPRSYLLQNNNGVFTDVTSKICPELLHPGMVTAAVWTDFDNDHQIDLVLAGEWMPLRFFKNNQGLLSEITTSTGLQQMYGMWRSLIASDIDNDGDMDFVAGNLGLNCPYRVSTSEPMQLFATDLDGNGSMDPIMFYFIKENEDKKQSFPSINRNQFAEQVSSIKKRYLLHKDFSNASYLDIFKGVKNHNIEKLYCDETRSCIFENLGNAKFLKRILPKEAQFSPINTILCLDVDNDGFKDLLLAGNEYQTEVKSGRYDASYGCYLKGGQNLSFETIRPIESGFIVDGDVKDLALIHLANGEKIILVAANNDSLTALRIGNLPIPITPQPRAHK